MRSQLTIFIGRPLGSAVPYFRNSLWPDPQIVPNDKLPYESRRRAREARSGPRVSRRERVTGAGSDAGTSPDLRTPVPEAVAGWRAAQDADVQKLASGFELLGLGGR